MDFQPVPVPSDNFEKGLKELNARGYVYLQGESANDAYIFPKPDGGDIMNRTVFSMTTSHLHLVWTSVAAKAGVQWYLPNIVMTVRVGDFDKPAGIAGPETYHPLSPLEKDFANGAAVAAKVNAARAWWGSAEGKDTNNNVIRIFEEMRDTKIPAPNSNYYQTYLNKWLEMMVATKAVLKIWFGDYNSKINCWRVTKDGKWVPI